MPSDPTFSASDPGSITSVFRRRKVTFDHLLTRDLATQRAQVRARHLATLDSTVLIQGEPGTGKSLLAQAIHNASARAGRPFRILGPGDVVGDRVRTRVFGGDEDSGVLPAAESGTLVLDELQDWPEGAQLIFEQFVDFREYPTTSGRVGRHADVRLIATISAPVELGSVVPHGMSPGLYQRLRGCEIQLPSLAARRADLGMLALHFLSLFAASTRQEAATLGADALAAIQSRRWYGNLRELDQAMRSAAIAATPAGVIRAADLPAPMEPVLGAGQLPYRIDALERWAYLRALQATSGNRSQAIELLGVAPATFYRKAKSFGLLSARPEIGRQT